MPKASKETASEHEAVEGYEGHFEHFDGGWTVGFETYTQDADLAPLWNDLRASGRPLLLVVTGDHGEALGDHGELTHGLFAYEATLHVPLLIWSPGHVAPRRPDG